MKIAIVSDMHLGYDRFGGDAYGQAKRAIDTAASMADAIIIPGDVFDKRVPNPETISQAIMIFKQLQSKEWGVDVSQSSATSKSSAKVPIVAISGTHERTAIGRDNALHILDLAGLLIDTSETTTIISKGNERVAIFGIGGISEETVVEKLKELQPSPVDGAFNIFMFHQSVYELLPFSENFMRLDDLPKGFDLYVDGHIHNMVEADVHGKKLLIPGSTVITQLKDSEQDSKGFILFDTKDYGYKFISIGSRRFISMKIDVTGKDREQIQRSINDVISEAIESGDRPIIRVKLTGELRHGISNSDIGAKGIISKYSNSAYLDIDTSKMRDPDLEMNIDMVRNAKMNGLSVKERGLEILKSQLNQQSVSMKVNVSEFMDFLVNGPAKKEKMLEDALKLLESG